MNSVSIPGQHLNQLLSAAAMTGTYVIMGTHERVGATLYNTMILIDGRRREFTQQRKLVPTYGERLVWGRGDGSTLSVFPTTFGNLGGLICWEHWMPLARAAMHAKNETFHVAQWPSVNEIHQLASRHYAFEGRCFVLAAGSVLSRRNVMEGFHTLGLPSSEALEILEGIPGPDEGLIQNGGSAIIGPDAAYLAGPVFDEPGIIFATVEPERTLEAHLVLDVDGHYARPDVFQLTVNDQPQINVSYASQIQRKGV